MDKQQIFNTPQYLDKYDIQRIFSVGISKAESIMRAIKAVAGDKLGKGKVTITEYQIWYEMGGKGNEEGKN